MNKNDLVFVHRIPTLRYLFIESQHYDELSTLPDTCWFDYRVTIIVITYLDIVQTLHRYTLVVFFFLFGLHR